MLFNFPFIFNEKFSLTNFLVGEPLFLELKNNDTFQPLFVF
jgi:hypothetical protein